MKHYGYKRTLKKWIEEIHENAVEHGWWDEERSAEETYALIHSEWSEALEEARAGRANVWYGCRALPVFCDEKQLESCEGRGPDGQDGCECRGKKPEGVCVELIDGVIRILDYFGSHERLTEDIPEEGTPNFILDKSDRPLGRAWAERIRQMTAAELVCRLHNMTSQAWRVSGWEDKSAEARLLKELLVSVFEWIRGRGLDPEELMEEKHEYNRTRPYKHGKLF